jgi:hypothetical protein
VSIGDGKSTLFGKQDGSTMHHLRKLPLTYITWSDTREEVFTLRCSSLIGSRILEVSTFQLYFRSTSDGIIWRWTPDGQYAVALAYECQFQGTIGVFLARSIWQAMSKPKCKFFFLLAMRDKILTYDNMVKRNWPCNHNCTLCFCIHEATEHLPTHCNFIEAAWNLVAARFTLPDCNAMSATRGFVHWIKKLISEGSKKDKKRKLGMLCTFWWLIWKDQNKRVFENKHSSVLQVARLVQEEIKLQFSVFDHVQ